MLLSPGKVLLCPWRVSRVGVEPQSPGTAPSLGWESMIKIPSSRKREGKWDSHSGSRNMRVLGASEFPRVHRGFPARAGLH